MGKIKGKWQGHLEAAQGSGLGLAGYAAKHDINVRRFYEARRAPARAKAEREGKASAFVRVKIKPGSAGGAHHPRAIAALAMQARLGNGVIVNKILCMRNASHCNPRTNH